MPISNRSVLLAGAVVVLMSAPAQSQSPARTTTTTTTTTTPAVQGNAVQGAPAKQVRKASMFKDDPTIDPRDKALDKRIRSICRGC